MGAVHAQAWACASLDPRLLQQAGERSLLAACSQQGGRGGPYSLDWLLLLALPVWGQSCSQHGMVAVAVAAAGLLLLWWGVLRKGRGGEGVRRAGP